MTKDRKYVIAFRGDRIADPVSKGLLWEIKTGRTLRVYDFYGCGSMWDYNIQEVFFSPNDRYAVCLTMDMGFLLDLEKADVIDELDHTQPFFFCPNNCIVYTPVKTGQAVMLDAASKKKTEFSFADHVLAVSPDCQYFVCQLEGQTFCWGNNKQYPVEEKGKFMFTHDCEHLFSIDGNKLTLNRFMENKNSVAYITDNKHYALYHRGMVIGGDNEHIHQYEPAGYRINDTCVVTAVRLWDFVTHKYQEPSTICPACGKELKPDEKLITTINKYMETYIKDTLTPYFLQLPTGTWSDNALHSCCPYCGTQLRFSPFIA